MFEFSWLGPYWEIGLSLDLLIVSMVFFRKPILNLLKELKDWRTILIFGIVMLVLGSEVWIPYILFMITNKPVYMIIATGGLFFWNVVPFTPFLPICLAVTIAIKKLMKKIKERRINKNERKIN